MEHLLLFLFCIIAALVFVYTDFINFSKSVANNYKKIIQVISSNNISDHWKEKVLPFYSIKLMIQSLKIFLLIFILVLLFWLFSLFDKNFLELSFSWTGLFESFLFIYILFKIKNLLSSQ